MSIRRLAEAAFPAGWIVEGSGPDPEGNDPAGTLSCVIGTKPEGSTVVVAEFIEEKAEDTAEALARECEPILGYTDPVRAGVLFVRVDTNHPRHQETLVDDSRQFAASLLSSIPAE